MSILIGNARGGDPTYTPGDQTENEVRTQVWYLPSSGWHFVARFKSRAKAAKAAKFCRAACANQHIGYGRGDRNTLRPLAKAAHWDAAKVTQDCNCDCTSFVSVCAEAGGVNMDSAYTYGNAPYSANIREKLEATGEFIILTDRKYLTSDQYLMCGDIVVNEPVSTGHAVMVLEDGPLAGIVATTAPPTETATAPAQTTVEKKATGIATDFDRSLTGAYTVTAPSGLPIKNAAGDSTASMAILPRGTEVWNYGYYTPHGGVKWLYIQVTHNGVTYIGFMSSQYLRKQ